MNGATVDFALTRFEAVDGARLEVEGTWSGVRGVRFVRPALVVHDDTGERTLLADLEHKPWPAQEGETWVAAFPWTGGAPDATRAELAVAPSIVVPLARATATRAAPQDPVDALRARLAAAEERGRRLEAEVAFLRREREERERPAREAVRAELRQRDEARAERERALAERDAALAERDAVAAERDALRGELRERDQVAEGAARRREQALAERDRARREGEQAAEAARRAVAEAEERATERERRRADERVERVAGALAAAEAERDRALVQPAGVAAPPVRNPREHAADHARADWAARTAAIVAVLVLLVLAITFLKAIG